MSPQAGDTVGNQLQTSLDLLHRLYLDVEAAGIDRMEMLNSLDQTAG
jgi:hypothetical protein